MSESNRLSILTREIQVTHEHFLGDLHRTVEQSLEVGRLLHGGRDLVTSSGLQWRTWLKEHVRVSEEMANRYMELSVQVSESRVDVSSIANSTRIGGYTEEEILERAHLIEELCFFAQRAEERQVAQRERLKAEMTAALPDRKYRTLVVDPPWDMPMIDRPLQRPPVRFDYPTMTEDDLAVLPIGALAADDCWLFCWTTQSLFDAAKRLLACWGFEVFPVFFTWHKLGGFQPLGQPQFNGEYVVLGRRGSPRFIDTKDFPCVFSAPSREGSLKPNEFYDIVRRVTDAARIEVFSREARPGFEQFGKHVDTFGTAAESPVVHRAATRPRPGAYV